MKENGMKVNEKLTDGQRIGRPSKVGCHLLGNLIHRLTRIGHATCHRRRTLVIAVLTSHLRPIGHQIGRHDRTDGIKGHLIDGLILDDQVKELQYGAQTVPVTVVEDEHQ